MVPHATRIRRSTVAARTAMFGESWTVIFADTRSTVLLFETILPTRDYIDPGDAAFEHVEPSSMQKLYPYTGGLLGYWSVWERHQMYPVSGSGVDVIVYHYFLLRRSLARCPSITRNSILLSVDSRVPLR